MRAVLDTNVVISGLISPDGPPAQLIDRWSAGAFELVASPRWLLELDGVVKRPAFVGSIDLELAARVRSLIVHEATLFDDPPAQPGLTPDPKDDYIVALARAAGVGFIVSGDRHLLGMAAAQPPVVGPRVFLALLDAADRP